MMIYWLSGEAEEQQAILRECQHRDEEELRRSNLTYCEQNALKWQLASERELYKKVSAIIELNRRANSRK